MKLKEGFVLHSIGEDHMAVATGEAAKSFQGIVRNNETAAFVFELLQQETTEEEVVQAMCQRYDAEESRIRQDVVSLISQMKKAGFLDE